MKFPEFPDRSVPVAAEFQFRSKGKGTQFTAYAALFNSPSQPLPFIETVSPAAFARSLKAGRTHALVLDHDDQRQVVSTFSGNLRLAEDTHGLLTDAELPETRHARDLREAYEAREVRGMSFTFKATKNGVQYSADGNSRTLNDVVLGHVSALTILDPAYQGTSGTVQIRALAQEMEADVDDIDELLDGIREGRALSDPEKNLLTRLAAKYTPVPEANEPDGPLVDWKARLSEKGIL